MPWSNPVSDIFASTAEYYARYRRGYSPVLFAHLRATFGLVGTGRLLDLGCGTGEVSRPLHPDFAEVVGVDSSPEMIAEAQRQADQVGISNIAWHSLPAEAISGNLGSFRLVTIGNAFHWMRHDEVLTKAHALLEPGGGIAILGNPGFVWGGVNPWEETVREVVVRWLGPRRRTSAGFFPAEEGDAWIQAALARSPFTDAEGSDFHWQRPVDVDHILGELYSTSFANRTLLGDRAEPFAADLRQSLLALEPTGQFIQRVTTGCLIAHKRK
jgi:SAM-dependent methyltransferase